MSLEVKYIDVPEGAQEAAQAQSSVGQPFSVAADVLNEGKDIAWATLETRGWMLDGTRKILKDSPRTEGWWSAERSGEDGTFTNPPVLEISFSEAYTATGITFSFWPSANHWCSKLQVHWYNAETLLAQAEVMPTTPDWILQQTVSGFNRIRITILKTNIGGQFAKIQQIRIGQVIVFGKEELVKVALLNEIDPSGFQMCVDTMEIQIRDRAGRNLAPQKNQRLELYQNGVQVAAQYVETANREKNHHYSFSCYSAVGRLEDTFLGGMYTLTPVRELLDQVLESVPFVLDSAFNTEMITGYLPVTSRRQALQQIAFAIGAAVSTQGDGTVRIFPLPQTISAAFDDESIFPGATVKMTPTVAKVQVYAHSYVPIAEEETLLEDAAVETEQLFVFSEPHHAYSVSGGTLISSGVNWAIIAAGAAITLKAKKYAHTKAVYHRQNPLATAAEQGNVITVAEVTLVSAENAQRVLNRVFEIKQLRSTLQQNAVIDGQKAGIKVTSVNPWGTATEGYITSMESELTQNGHTAKVTILGREVSR